jgi:hypothetical protein
VSTHTIPGVLEAAVKAFQGVGLHARTCDLSPQKPGPQLIIAGGTHVETTPDGIRLVQGSFTIEACDGGYLVRLAGPGQLVTEERFEEFLEAIDHVITNRLPGTR